MSILLPVQVNSRTTTRRLQATLSSFPQSFVQQNRPLFHTRKMNTLQEGSRVYKALKKGPSFGGWQVSVSMCESHSW